MRMISVHRLVQAEYLFRTDVPERQEYFEGVITLLLEAFPKRGQSRMIDKEWPKGDLHIQHLLSLATIYKRERHRSSPLTATTSFCDLMCNAAW